MNAKQAVQKARLQESLKGYDRTPDLISKELSSARDKTDLLDQISYRTERFQDKNVKSLINSLFRDDKKERQSLASTEDETEEITAAVKRASEQTQKAMGFFSLLEDKFANQTGSAQKPGQVSNEELYVESAEVISLGTRVKSAILVNLTKINSLSMGMVSQLEQYLGNTENLEAMKGDMSIFYALGGAKYTFNKSALKGLEVKKFSYSNRPYLTARPSNNYAAKLPREVNRVHSPRGQKSAFEHVNNSKRMPTYLDTMSRNHKYKQKKILGSKEGPSGAGGADYDTIDDEDFQVFNQFPIDCPLNFDVLGPYSLYFLKRFVTKFVLQSYIKEVISKNKSPFIMEGIPFNELDAEGGWNLQNECPVVRRQTKADLEQIINNKKQEDLQSLRRMRLAPFSTDPKPLDEEDYLKITPRVPNPYYKNPPYLRMKANKYYRKKETFAQRVFTVYEFRLFWSSTSSSNVSGWVDLRVCKIGMSNHNGTPLLSLHPRNNGDSLLIQLNEEGQVLRKELIEIKAWLEMYNYCFDKIVIPEYTVGLFGPMDSTYTPREAKIDIHLIKQNLYSDAFFMRYIHCRSLNITSVTLYQIVFSPDGIHRLTEFFEEAKGINRVHLESNYFDDIGTESVLDALLKSSVDRLRSLKIIRNKLSDVMVLSVFDTIASSKSSPLSTPIEEINLSYSGIGDSCFLGLHGLFNKYAHEDSTFRLGVSGNPISERGLLLLSELLAQYPILHTIELRDLKGIDPDKNNIKALVEKLTSNRTLREIDFRGNSLTAQSFQSVINYLGNSASIEKISIDLNHKEVIATKPSNYATNLSIYRFSLEVAQEEVIEDKEPHH
jgi:hypothetical protein